MGQFVQGDILSGLIHESALKHRVLWSPAGATDQSPVRAAQEQKISSGVQPDTRANIVAHSL